MLTFNKKNLKWGLRLSIIFACFVSIAAVFMNSNRLIQKNYQLLYEQTEVLSRMVVRQAAQTAYTAMRFGDNENIQQLVENLAREEFIFDVTIYDKEGNYLYGSENTLALSELTGLNTPLSVASIGRHQFVEPISQNGKFAGFLRITLEHNRIIKEASNKLNSNINSIHTMLLIALFTGAVLITILARRIEFWLSPFISNPHN